MANLTIANVIDRARERHDLKSDYALCKALGCSTQLVANWRHGRNLPDEKSCALLAEMAGLDPLVLTAQVQAQRSKTAEARSVWEQIAERLQLASRGAVAAIFAAAIAIGLIAAPADDASAGERFAPQTHAGNSLYIVSSGMLLLIAALAWLAMRPNGRPINRLAIAA